MFTGIIKAVGHIERIDDHGSDARMYLDTGALSLHDLPEGASIAVNGVCLTAVDFGERGFAADVSAETLRVTTLGQLRKGAPVNLEPALRMGEPLDGHVVSGHVDCVAQVAAIVAEGRGWQLSISVPQAFSRYIARKGSVAVDGVSLTVNSVADADFEVMIVPHTQSATIIQHYDVGTAVNIEVDVVARYLERLSGR